MSLWLVSDLPVVQEGRGCSGEAPLNDSAAFAASAGEWPRPTLRQPRLGSGPVPASQGWSCPWTMPAALLPCARPLEPIPAPSAPSRTPLEQAGHMQTHLECSAPARRCGQHPSALARPQPRMLPGAPSSGHRPWLWHKERGDPTSVTSGELRDGSSHCRGQLGRLCPGQRGCPCPGPEGCGDAGSEDGRLWLQPQPAPSSACCCPY